MEQIAKKDNFFKRAIKGFIIGVCGILPGASGGVLAVAMGVYRPIIDGIVGFFKAPKANFLFLLPIGLGALTGFLSTSRAIEFLILNFYAPVMFAMIGLVLGGVPSFIAEANEGGFKKRYLFGTAFGLLLVGGLALLDNTLTGGQSWEFNAFTAIAAGGILAVGTVIPGISTSFILMYIGLFEPMLAALNRFNIPMLACVGAGAIVVGLALAILVKRMFDRHRGYAYYAVLGFLVGSIALIFPGFSGGLGQIALNIALLLAGVAISYIVCKTQGSKE